jgi:Uma2 family endonuclease
MSLVAPPTLPLPHRPLPIGQMRAFSVDEYHRMIKAGVLGEDEPVELLEGWILYKMTRNPPHDVAVALASKLLVRLLPDGWHVRPQAAITTEDSEPEPDLAVVRGDERLYLSRHPGPADTLLVIEVSDTSLHRDRVEKARVYARASIPTYWVVNLIDGRVEVHADPSGPGAPATYRSSVEYVPGQSIPLEVGGQRLEVRVNDLLP